MKSYTVIEREIREALEGVLEPVTPACGLPGPNPFTPNLIGYYMHPNKTIPECGAIIEITWGTGINPDDTLIGCAVYHAERHGCHRTNLDMERSACFFSPEELVEHLTTTYLGLDDEDDNKEDDES